MKDRLMLKSQLERRIRPRLETSIRSAIDRRMKNASGVPANAASRLLSGGWYIVCLLIIINFVFD